MLRFALMFVFLSKFAFGQGPMLPFPSDVKLDAVKAEYRVVGVINDAVDKGSSVIVLKNIAEKTTFQLVSGGTLDGVLVENSALRTVKISIGNRSRVLKYVEAEVEPSREVAEESKEDFPTADLESTGLEWDQVQEFKTLLEKQVKVSELGGGLDKRGNVNEPSVKNFDDQSCEVSVVGQSECFQYKQDSTSK
ncbi:MAG: hypothetical protein WCI18_01850 [Pseudomonadota bacterium]